MQVAKTNAERAAQIAERKAKEEAERAKIAKANAKLLKGVDKHAAKAAPAPKASKAKAKIEKATEWAMGEFTPEGIRIVARGDHNSIEKASASLNRKAGMRVAFVVDIRSVPLALLTGVGAPVADEEDEEEAAG